MFDFTQADSLKIQAVVTRNIINSQIPKRIIVSFTPSDGIDPGGLKIICFRMLLGIVWLAAIFADSPTGNNENTLRNGRNVRLSLAGGNMNIASDGSIYISYICTVYTSARYLPNNSTVSTLTLTESACSISLHQNQREASRENHTDLCGTSTTGARNSIFCPVNTSSTKYLRGQRSATVNKNVGPSNHRIKGNGVEVKSPDVEEGRKEKKRFLRWARDEEEKSNGSKRANKDHHGKAPAGDERYLRASVEGAAVVALRTSGEDVAVVDAAAAAKALRGRGRSDYALDGVPPA